MMADFLFISRRGLLIRCSLEGITDHFSLASLTGIAGIVCTVARIVMFIHAVEIPSCRTIGARNSTG
jgi:hypothetical protein